MTCCSNLHETAKSRLASRLKPIMIPPGHDLCHEGDPADCLWILQEGATGCPPISVHTDAADSKVVLQLPHALRCGGGQCRPTCTKAGWLLSCSPLWPDECVWGGLQTCTTAHLQQLLNAVHEAKLPSMTADLHGRQLL